jgi:20S proteasome subunit beta 5
MAFSGDFSFLDDPKFGEPDFYGQGLPCVPVVPREADKEGIEEELKKDLFAEGSHISLPIPHEQVILPGLPTSTEKTKLEQYKKGTTTLAFKFKEGIIVAVDARASMGSFIGSNKVRKVIEINDYLLGTMAGGAADCMYWERLLASQCRLYELQHNEKLTVRGASKMLLNSIMRYRGRGLSMGTMVAGCDISTGNTDLYFVDDDGIRIQGEMFSIGSGSPYAYGVLDTHYKYDMTLEQAVDLGIRAIINATFRDSGSGGVVRIYYVHKSGWKIIHDALDVSEQYLMKYGLK